MKHLIISDLHGRDCWQQIKIRNYDKVIFLGDYVDSPDLPDATILENLRQVLRFKKRHPNKVVLLLGNHDAHYMHYPRHQCSGFRPSMQRRLTYLFNKNRPLFRIAYQHQDHIFTHAGITNSWYDEFLRLPMLAQSREDGDRIADLINKVENINQRYLLYATSIYRGGYGNGGPLWADIRETAEDMLEGYHQIVGHTRIKKPHTITLPGRSITYVDVLDTLIYFHELDI